MLGLKLRARRADQVAEGNEVATYLTMPVEIADAGFSAGCGPTVLIVLACGLAMWVPAADVVDPTAVIAEPPQRRPPNTSY